MGDVNWRRVFAISSLIFALLLVCGSIYLHLQQKHHLGRLHHDDKVVVVIGGVDAASAAAARAANVNTEPPITKAELKISAVSFIENYNDYYNDRLSENNDDDDGVEDEDEDNDFDGSNENRQSLRKLLTKQVASDDAVDADDADDDALVIPPIQATQNVGGGVSISEACLQCICETTTQCQPSTCAGNEPCGVFRISRPYWIDGGRLRLDGDKSAPKELGADADYTNCVNNAFCSARTIVNFASKYSRDCNADGKIDCRDYISLHILGPSGCRLSTLSPLFAGRMEQCLVKFS